MIMSKDEYMALIEELVQQAIWHGAKCLNETVAYVKANCDYDVGEYIVEEIAVLYEYGKAGE